MTVDQIKEQLSNRFIGVLAANKGFAIDKGEIDLGIDYTLKKSYHYTSGSGKTRWNFDGRYIDLQLKATTDNSIVDGANSIKYDLEAKSYNDLVERQTNGTLPLVLILFILPNDQNTWVDIDVNELRLRKHAYWFVPPEGSVQTTNEYRVRIEIPKTNIIGLDSFNTLHEYFYP